MSKIQIDLPKEKIAEFCRKWKVKEFAVFGSVLRIDFRPDSDIDIIVDFEPNARISLFDLVSMTDELRMIFRRNVDLLTRGGVEQSRNYIRRKEILSSMQVIHAA
ncbi:MAG: nucleotidyltransferase [Nitrospiraceae bacterium]|nr:MAG: nucleotidyltransferase [Nitrospiraceae bacterium]